MRRRCWGDDLTLSRHLIELGEDLWHRDSDRGSGDGELAADVMLEAGTGGGIGVPAIRVNKPDVFDAHTQELIHAFLQIMKAIKRRKDLAADKWWSLDDWLSGANTTHDRHVWNEDTAG